MKLLALSGTPELGSMAVDADLVVAVGGVGRVVESQGVAGRHVAGDAGAAGVEVPRDEERRVVTVAVDRRGAKFTVGTGYAAANILGGNEGFAVGGGGDCAEWAELREPRRLPQRRAVPHSGR